MYEFKKIKIENFYSLGQVEFEFKKGVYLVKGVNKDVKSDTLVSNGAGKTSIFNAIYQCLFNKNLKDQKGNIQSVNNVYTKKPYVISLDFKKNENEFVIINDRNKMSIDIYKNGEFISPKGITNQLNLIKTEIINYDFDVITSLTYLNQTSLDSIIEITGKNNIVYRFFNVEKVLAYQESIQKQIRELKKEYELFLVQYNSIQDNLVLFDKIKEVEEVNYKEEIEKLKEYLYELETSNTLAIIKQKEEKYLEQKKKLDDLKEQVIELKLRAENLYKLKEELKEGVCPVCSSPVKDKYKIYEEQFKKADLAFKEFKNYYKQEKNKVDKLKVEYENLKNDFEKKKKSILLQIEKLKVKRDEYVKQKELKKQLEENLDKLKEKLEQLKEKRLYLTKKIDIYKEVLSLFKKGIIMNEFLKDYVRLLKLNIEFFKNKSAFEFDFEIKINKGSLDYKFVDKGVKKTFYQLSSGEKTRVSLLLLLATIKTLEELIGININFLVIDELLGVLDDEGIEFMKNVLNYLKQDKAIFIITHHNEIEETFADYLFTIVKENGISSLEVKELK